MWSDLQRWLLDWLCDSMIAISDSYDQLLGLGLVKDEEMTGCLQICPESHTPSIYRFWVAELAIRELEEPSVVVIAFTSRKRMLSGMERSLFKWHTKLRVRINVLISLSRCNLEITFQFIMQQILALLEGNVFVKTQYGSFCWLLWFICMKLLLRMCNRDILIQAVI